jgi:3-oxoacid CoA-transferase subunit A
MGGRDKVVGSAEEAVADIGDGASLAVGGFGVSERLRAGGCGIPAFFTPAGVGQGLALVLER